MLSAKALPIYAATVAAALSLMLTGCGQGSEAPMPTPGTGQAEQKQAAPARPKPEEKPDPNDPQVTGLPRADYDGSGPSGIYKGIPPAPPDPTDFPGMNENTDAGAIQTLKYWDTAYNYAAATGNISYAQKYSAKECESCKSALDNVVTKHKKGDYAKTLISDYTDQGKADLPEGKTYYLRADYRDYLDISKEFPAGKKIDKFPYLLAAYMAYREEGWVITEIGYKEGRSEDTQK
ncbi:DUF6318 family protein [Dermabacteraceae bacterium P7006]